MLIIYSCNDIEELDSIEKCKYMSNVLRTILPAIIGLSLRQLYLRKNKIATFEELKHLKPLSNLRVCNLTQFWDHNNIILFQVLWLAGNPISSQPNYRYTVAQMLPQLQQIDQSGIS